MENSTVQESEFENGQVEFPTRGPINSLLNRIVQKRRKLFNGSRLSEHSSKDSSTADSSLLQRYTFKITGYQIKEAVEYQIQLVEKRLVRGKVCLTESHFTTRYSKLLRLHEQLEPIAEFPPKKFFNSTKPEFLEIRRKQLELYLNEIAKEDSQTFEEFVRQIRKASVDSQLRI